MENSTKNRNKSRMVIDPTKWTDIQFNKTEQPKARKDPTKSTDGKSNKKQQPKARNKNSLITKIHPRKSRARDRVAFLYQDRDSFCLCQPGKQYLEVKKLQQQEIRSILAFKCKTIEHQIIELRRNIQLTPEDFQSRYLFTQLLLECLHRHHNVLYQGIMFGSSVNGLGFRDCDVDLRLRPLKHIGDNIYEPIILDEDMVDKTLRDIAYQTTICCPAAGDYVPSTRVPVAKVSFIQNLDNFKQVYRSNVTPEEGLKYDISLSTSTLSTFNSRFFRFLCYLEPKFHLLATVIKYWASNIHGLIVAGYLSSYALCNMLIFFCQNQTVPPILPSIDKMRDLYFKQAQDLEPNRGLSQLEWHCILGLRKEFYTPSTNTEPLSVLLLKFFEFYLKFPYSTHIITTRPGKALTHDEFKESTQYHRRFPIYSYLNIQDPFDLKHNLTSGMQGGHFRKLLLTIRHSYETLFKELLNNFSQPNSPTIARGAQKQMGKKAQYKTDPQIDWGLNALFIPIPLHQLKSQDDEPPKQQDLKKN